MAGLPNSVIGKRLAESLEGDARLFVSHLSAADLTGEDSLSNVRCAIFEPHRQYAEVKMEEAFEKAIFKTVGAPHETPTAFANKKKEASMALRQRGLDFTAPAEGRHLIGWLSAA